MFSLQMAFKVCHELVTRTGSGCYQLHDGLPLATLPQAIQEQHDRFKFGYISSACPPCLIGLYGNMNPSSITPPESLYSNRRMRLDTESSEDDHDAPQVSVAIPSSFEEAGFL